MDKKSARKLIRNTFQNSFDKEKFIYFIKNLLNQYDKSKIFHLHGCYIPDSFKDYIKSYERIGTYTDSEEKKIDILIVHLKRETVIDRARTAQRNFIARYLKERGEKDAGLIAFVSPQEEDWRFSFVKMEYKFEKTAKGDVKVKEEFTPARRYSFLVGENESSHTAQSCFVNILINDTRNLKLNEIEKAFNIEKVTKEFYEKYRNLFFQVKDALDEIVKEDDEIRKEFKQKGVNVVDFSKKLLGQIVFLYFLQKKGWFGVKEGQKWGTGPKNFLRELFEKKHCYYNNFFNDVLEPLFYEALRNDRSYDDHYFSYFNCKIPFLNGGLFDPLNDYNWVKTDILLPNILFSNQIKTKDGDIGTGVLDFFDRYNFTVKEDEPLEKEVAVDPEMLGKVFENLLEVKDRKSKGSYYTPREIVHYMCQQSLINYLYTEINNDSNIKGRGNKQNIQMKLLGKQDPIQRSLIIEKGLNIISKEDLEKLIKYGDTTIENENHVVTKGEETKTYSFKLPENIRKNAEIIDEALQNIRVCDPAIGSGAFPVGMMNEIIRARNVLTPYLSLREAEATKQSRMIYNFKRHAIQNCLYGVDIDPGAVEIAKLRLWLSLIVDEEDINKIKPLPNLDYKIVCGNSLLGIERNLENWKLFAKLEELKPLFFNETNASKKQEYKMQIDKLISEITNGHKDFDFEVYFSEVFHEKNGFDVVIANPPYVRQENLGVEYKKKLINAHKEVGNGIADLYVYFYALSVKLLKNNGYLAFITLNKWLKTKYGKELRNYLSGFHTDKIIDFFELPVFDASTDTLIAFIKKAQPNETKYFPIKTLENLDLNHRTKGNYKIVIKDETEWKFVNPEIKEIVLKIEKNKTNLKNFVNDKIHYGIKTGLNKAFIIDNATKEQICNEDPKSKEIIKPYIRPTSIKKIKTEWKGDWLINSHNGVKGKIKPIDVENDYPAVYKWLSLYLPKIKQRQDKGIHWSNLRNCAYIEEFKKDKIIYIHTSKKHQFYFDENGYFVNNSCYLIVTESKFIWAFLNSKLFEWFKKIKFVAYGDADTSGRAKLDYNKMKTIPLVQVSEKQEKIFENLYLKMKKFADNTTDLEREIDQLIYKLYGLTEEEIKIVEEKKCNEN